MNSPFRPKRPKYDKADQAQEHDHDLGDLAVTTTVRLLVAIGNIAGEAGENQERGGEDDLRIGLFVAARAGGELGGGRRGQQQDQLLEQVVVEGAENCVAAMPQKLVSRASGGSHDGPTRRTVRHDAQTAGAEAS